jgi:hypothetical protein
MPMRCIGIKLFNAGQRLLLLGHQEPFKKMSLETRILSIAAGTFQNKKGGLAPLIQIAFVAIFLRYLWT